MLQLSCAMFCAKVLPMAQKSVTPNCCVILTLFISYLFVIGGINFILKMRNLKLRQSKYFDHWHRVKEWQSWHLKQALFDFKVHFLLYHTISFSFILLITPPLNNLCVLKMVFIRNFGIEIYFMISTYDLERSILKK